MADLRPSAINSEWNGMHPIKFGRVTKVKVLFMSKVESHYIGEQQGQYYATRSLFVKAVSDSQTPFSFAQVKLNWFVIIRNKKSRKLGIFMADNSFSLSGQNSQLFELVFGLEIIRI
jgi:hypothetical protein